MSDVGAKITAAISRHNKKREATRELAERIAQDRESVTGVVAGTNTYRSPAATDKSENGGEQ